MSLGDQLRFNRQRIGLSQGESATRLNSKLVLQD